MTTLDTSGIRILPREITFSEIELPAKRSVSVIFEDGTEHAATFHFTHLDYSDEQLVEVYWWDSNAKTVGFYGIIEELSPFEVNNPTTGATEFIVLPRNLDIEKITDNRIKTIKMSPNLWIYEVDGL